MNVPSLLPLVLLSIVAPLGAFDVLWFHIYKFRLYDQPSARCETLTHLVRGVLFAFGALILARYQAMGGWFWLVTAIFVADFVNNVVDVMVEAKSRAPLGGLPSNEYLLHIIGSTFAGAIAIAFVMTSWSNATEPTALVHTTSVPKWLMWLGTTDAVGGLLLTVLEGGLLLRSIAKSCCLPRRSLA